MDVFFFTVKQFLHACLLVHTNSTAFLCHNQLSAVVFQCADDQDAVCTRSVTLSLASLEDMIVKLKHGGIVSVNSMDIQTPMHHGIQFHFSQSITVL